ncbi:hypothetical protein RSAG8_13557, partial [Rhizoctonia solani AG-8 WAC10335]
MAPQKRTRDLVDQPGPSTSLLKAEKSKKAKRSHEPGSYDTQAAPAGKKKPSTLLTEEVDFPRGGGVTLEELHESANSTAMEVDGQPTPIKKKSRTERGNKDKKGKKNGDERASTKSDTIRVEHLNYKRLEPGQRLLGQITSILPLALIVSLPNQLMGHVPILMGHVPIVNISSQLTSRLESTPSSSSEAEESEAGEDDGVPSLLQMFKPGQYVSCTVKQVRPASSTIDFGAKPRDEEEKASRRVELSIRPNEVNVGVGAGDLRAGFYITGAIQSVEDHGYIVDLGIPDISGFVPYKDKSKPDTKRLSVGQVVTSTVVKLSENKRLCTLSTKSDAVQNASLTEATSAHALLPGALVSALVTAVVPSGLNLQVLSARIVTWSAGYFGGTIELFHLPGGTDSIKEGDKVKARVLWDIPGSSPPRFALSLLPHIIQLTLASTQPAPVKESKKSKKKAQPISEDVPTLREAYPVGMLIEAVKVTRVESEWGLVCELAGGVGAFVHISQISDSLVPQLSSVSGAWRIGSSHRARVIGYHALDGLLLLSLKPSVLELEYMQVADVEVGKFLKGTIVRLRETGLVVALSDKVTGLVTPQHYADIKLKHPERKFKEGAIVKCKVLSVNPERSRILLTLKKSLLESTLPILATFDDAKVGMVTPGIVQRIEERFVILEYYGGVKALVPLNELTDTQNLKRVDVSIRKSRLEPNVKHKIVDREIQSVEELKAGEKVRGMVKSVAQHGLFVMLGRDLDARGREGSRDGQIKELFDEYVKDWQSRFSVGQVVETRVLAVNPETNQIELTMRSGDINKLLKRTAGLSDFQVGQKVEGRVKSVKDFGIFIEIARTKISGLSNKSEISDNKNANVAEALKSFREDDPVKAVILSIDTKARKISFGIKPSYYFDEEDFAMKDASDGEDGSEDEDQNEDELEDENQEESEDEGSEGGSEDEDSDEELADAIAEVTLPEETVTAPKTITSSSNAPVLSLSGGFSWSGQHEDAAEKGPSESAS